jgi:hypothetical protein
MNPDTPNFLPPDAESLPTVTAAGPDSLPPTQTPLEQLLAGATTPSDSEFHQDLEQALETKTEIPPPVATEVKALEQQKQALLQEIANLQAQKVTLVNDQLIGLQTTLQQWIAEGSRELEQRKQALEKDIDRLERRQERIQQEMRTTFAGASQELAIRVQGFKDYLVGSLQDLVAAADNLELGTGDPWNQPAPALTTSPPPEEVPLGFANQSFIEQKRQIQRLIEQYRSRPDYYGPPWQLRRTFEVVPAERVENWFLTQGGRGVVRSLGSRLQNILLGSAVISILANLYGERHRALILANTPERLGEWRRGLQDCLGISRSDFGPERGIGLFESPEALIQKAERLVEDRQMPLVLIDETEEQIDLALLQFPLWLAFAPDPKQSSSYFY